MNIFKFAEKRMMNMDNAAWKKHANPLSCYSRFTCLPLIAVAVWSREWIGWWSIVALLAAVFWTWINPRSFKIPKNTNNWASKGTFGERMLLNHNQKPIPHHHKRMAIILSVASLPGILLMIYGLTMLNAYLAIFGVITAILPKVWFVDRMVWLYEDMAPKHKEYAAWLYTDSQKSSETK